MLVGSIAEKRWPRRMYYNYFSRLYRKARTIAYVIPYSKLSQEEQHEFEWRAHYFLATTSIEFKQFEKEVKPVFRRVRFMIASVAAQMTFRLPDNCFSIYDRILIYPDYYYSQISKQYHKGETNPAAGLMVFSLRGITEGFQLPYDGVNLLYHEMAHALYLEHKAMDYNLFDEHAFDRFHKFANNALAEEHSTDYFLRSYALTNVHEYFAVATENFFERPAEFSTSLPELFTIMRDLYQQNPLELK